MKRLLTVLLLLATVLLCGSMSFASAEEGDFVIFEGRKTAQGKDAMLDFYFTEHVSNTLQ